MPSDRPIDPLASRSTGEDHPDEWPVEGWEAVRLLAKEWSPPPQAAGAALALAALGALTWASLQGRSVPPANLAARPGIDAHVTGSIGAPGPDADRPTLVIPR